MENIEVEIRAFVNDEQYSELLNFFEKNAELVTEDEQETHYLSNSGKDLRIQKNLNYAKIWMKEGKIHDDCREEIEIRTKKEDFSQLEKLFSTLGYEPEIKWFRKRKEYKWNDVTVCLDDTKGY
ncbi:MAG: CYTH domain-containing protein, partial [Candidatus Micrarchaeota archaeon]